MTSIRIEGRYGGPMLRDGVAVVFFRQAPFVEWAPEVAALFDLFLQTAPAASLTHALVGARASKITRVDATTVARCKLQLDAGKAAQRKLNSFEIGGPEQVNRSWQFDVWGGDDAQPAADCERTNYVAMRIPTEFVDETGDNLASFVARCAELLTFDSGYASLALHWSTDGELVQAAKAIPGLALRHPGLDLAHLPEIRFGLGQRMVGARWLTLLGPALVSELGGEEELRAVLEEHVAVDALAGGVALRAPGRPRAGDVNRGDDLPKLRAMASVLESVTYEAPSSKLLVNPDALQRWQRRFFES